MNGLPVVLYIKHYDLKPLSEFLVTIRYKDNPKAEAEHHTIPSQL